ncbi:Hsp70 domain containing protein [Amanita muscaria]
MSALPPVVGINFGNSYASIAVFTKENVAECIANQDGERQIACAIAFIGQEVYIGNQAKPHLVKNAKSTLLGFRDLLGISYDEIPSHLGGSLVQHPDDPSIPAWKLEVLQPPPRPLPPLSNSTHANTPSASAQHSALATPASEPVPVTRYITALEASTLFLHSLAQSAEDFLGNPLTGAVITVPSSFTPKQRSALLQAAKDASIPVLQLLDESGAAALTTLSPTWCAADPLPGNRTQLLIDVGHSSTTITLLVLREGLIIPLASSTHPIGGHTVDELLLKHFCTEFTKKTKTPLNPKDTSDTRSIQKLLLALEHTKRTISASPTAASLSIESLKSGIDFTSTINRLRFDLLARPFYAALSTAVQELLSSTQQTATDPITIDEIVYVGGTASLPGLDEHLSVSSGFREDAETAFKRGEVVGGGVGDPTTILSRGCTYQALLVSELAEDQERNGNKDVLEGIQREEKKNVQATVTSRTIGLVFPKNIDALTAAGNGDAAHPDSLTDELTRSAGGSYVPLILKETPLPARRTFNLLLILPPNYSSPLSGGEGGKKSVLIELWEVEEGIKIEKRKPSKELPDDDEDSETVKDGGDEDEEEEEEVKHAVINKLALVGVLEVPVKEPPKATGKKAQEAKDREQVLISIKAVRSIDGGLVVEACHVEGGAKVVLQA